MSKIKSIFKSLKPLKEWMIDGTFRETLIKSETAFGYCLSKKNTGKNREVLRLRKAFAQNDMLVYFLEIMRGALNRFSFFLNFSDLKTRFNQCFLNGSEKSNTVENAALC